MLPGVTVEASSPALIEKVRSTVTDDRGEYRLPELRPGAYTRDVHAAGIRHLQARRPGAADELHRADRRRDDRQSAPGNDHRHRGHAAGGRAGRDAAADGLARSARHGADRQERARHRGADSRGRRAAERAGRRRQQGRALGPHLRARRQDLRLAAAAGRHALQRADAGPRQPRRHGPRLLRQPAGRPGSRRRPGHDGLGRVLAGRRAGEQHSQGRRQPVQRLVLRRRHRRQPPEQQPRRRADQPGADVGQQRQEGLRLQRRRRRAGVDGPPVVLRRRRGGGGRRRASPISLPTRT